MIEKLQRDMYEKKITELKDVLGNAYMILYDNDLISRGFEKEILDVLYDYSEVSKKQSAPVYKMLEMQEMEKLKFPSIRPQSEDK